MKAPTLLWFRQDLRLRDQPALVAAAETGPVIPIYILDDAGAGRWATGGAQRWWLHHSLVSLAGALEARGSRLILRRGNAVAILNELAEQTGAAQIHAIRHYEPWWRTAEAALADRLRLHDGNRLAPPESVVTGSGGMFKVFSAFYRALAEHLPPDAPLPVPSTIAAPANWPESDPLESWGLLPTRPNWATGFDVWMPGEDTARARAEEFGAAVAAYADDRNLPSIDGSSRLSPHLHFGEISPRDAWGLVGGGEEAATFHKELAWRDFASGVILERPDYAERHGRPAFERLAYRQSAAELAAWQRGRTGYPIVDAGMRQLWATGWMHNRVRMIAASFLVKHLLIDWREGERWFWDTLVDADYANNAVNWQWVAGSGVDSNMFSRIMAPLVQSEKFDAGDYIRRWVPELSGVGGDAVHDPDAAGCRPAAYPPKIVGHREARERALAAGRALR
jgi:deoxyribodipyrimidine photo-lyase